MRFFDVKISPLILILFVSQSLWAQDSIVVKQWMNEIGLKTEFGFAYGGEQDFAGIQYRHTGSNNFGYRLYAGFGVVSTGQDNVAREPGTVNDKYTTVAAGTLIAGGGIMRQYPLSKHLYLFVAVEANIGYGWGEVDTTLIQPIPAPPPSPYPYYTDYDGPNVHMLFIGLAASPGIEVRLKRFAAGLEFPLSITDEIILEGHNSNNTRGQVALALFAGYRF